MSGSIIQLYSVGLSGYGSAPTALLAAPVTTDANGSFTLTGAYTCPAPTSQLYIVASGGNPGLSAGTNNSAIALMAALGSCSQYNASSFININEVTTIAAIFALRPFLDASALQVGTSSTNLTGLINAFQTAANLASVATGTALATPASGSGTSPQARVNTLANILAACVNSASPSSASCTALFTDTTISGSAAPVNTLQAAQHIAAHPASSAAALFALSPSSSPFQPSLSNAPADWSLLIAHGGGNLTNPQQIAIDAAGNIWVSNSTGTSAVLSEYSNAGVPIETIAAPSQAIALDPAGNLWSLYGSTVSKYSSSGTLLSGTSGYKITGLASPRTLAVDPSGNVWIAGYDSSTTVGAGVVKMGNDGTQLAMYTAATMTSPAGIAFTPAGVAWIADINDGNVTRLDASGNALAFPAGPRPYLGPATTNIDAQGGAWIGAGIHLYHYDASGNLLSPTYGYTNCVFVQGPCTNPLANNFALDGDNNVWAPVSFQSGTQKFGIAELSSSGALLSGSVGLGTDYPFEPAAIAIDSSGSVWGPQFSNLMLVQLVGVAGPVLTPTSLAAHNNLIATRP